MDCVICGSTEGTTQHTFWCVKSTELKPGTVPVHSFTFVLCDRCKEKRLAKWRRLALKSGAIALLLTWLIGTFGGGALIYYLDKQTHPFWEGVLGAGILSTLLAPVLAAAILVGLILRGSQTRVPADLIVDNATALDVKDYQVFRSKRPLVITYYAGSGYQVRF
jgi:hypothetical protein